MKTVTITKPGRHSWRLEESESLLLRVLQLDDQSEPIDCHITLAGQNASVQVVGLFANLEQTANRFNCVLQHLHSHTQASVLVKGIVGRQSRVDFAGLIKIERGAFGSESFLEHRSLLLDDTAAAYPEPTLEIMANEVKASHAATVSHLDKTSRFYLASRGITQKEADRLLIHSFLATPLQYFDLPERKRILSKINVPTPTVSSS